MKQIKFRNHLAEEIISGDKRVTMRLFDDKDLQTGDAVELVNSDSGQVFALARITTAVEKPLAEVTAEDHAEMALYPTLEDRLATFREYYGDAVTPLSPAKLLYFKVDRLV